jgi:hypothetical protein
MTGLATLFDLKRDEATIAAIVGGPAFTRHSKSGDPFGQTQRVDEQRLGTSVHADEIEKVAIWAEAVADATGIPINLPNPLLSKR